MPTDFNSTTPADPLPETGTFLPDLDPRPADALDIPVELPTNPAPPTVAPFNLDAYRAERAARPLAAHKAELIERLQKALFHFGFENSPLSDFHIVLFALVVQEIDTYRAED
jgi:hypothetical protein